MDENYLKNVGKRIGAVSDLPPELVEQLQISKVDELESKILSVIKEDFEGYANIDEILVGLFRKHQLLQKRRFLANKLYRMAKDGLLFSIKGKKGVYSITEK